ncbi:hypothetical protein BpHYR1_015915 [Brachionus plicatilis]|uniref:Uncharacterized protein n=1 Tax=Brachionus plicatilis TaxID=10195 RepID=A0A3M7P3X0_BRAPC|nr:hypothetical protein BpHYR1_015915 [Brachionus plicatilis]
MIDALNKKQIINLIHLFGTKLLLMNITEKHDDFKKPSNSPSYPFNILINISECIKQYATNGINMKKKKSPNYLA